jgi:hypothetical protein
MGTGHPRLRPTRPAGSVLLVALLCMFVLSVLGTVFLGISLTEHNITYNTVYSEGAFTAAEAGIQAGVAQLSPNTTTSTQAIPSTAFVGNYNYQSGHRADRSPQPLEYVGNRTRPGFNLSRGNPYIPKGWVFRDYRIAVTGAGPRAAQREVEVLAEYGPTAE